MTEEVNSIELRTSYGLYFPELSLIFRAKGVFSDRTPRRRLSSVRSSGSFALTWRNVVSGVGSVVTCGGREDIHPVRALWANGSRRTKKPQPGYGSNLSMPGMENGIQDTTGQPEQYGWKIHISGFILASVCHICYQKLTYLKQI